MSTLRFVQTPAVALYTGISTSATSMRIVPYPVDLDGNQLTMTDFGDTPTCTIDPKVSGFEEIVSFTGITDNGDNTATLTGLTRDLTSKYPYTTAGTGKIHGSSAVVVFSDNPQLYGRLASKENNETILGLWDFPTPVNPSNPVRLSDLMGVVAGTVPSASTTIQGSTKLSQTPARSLGTATITIATPGVVSNTAHGLIAGDQVKFTTTGALPTGLVVGTIYYVIAAGLTANAFELSGTLAGAAINTTGSQSGTHTLYKATPVALSDLDPRIFPNAYAADVGASDTYAITLTTAPSAYAVGQLYAFKANTVNTGAATLNVNSLGAITIKKGGTTDLTDGDIPAGAYVLVMYDTGGNFQLMACSTMRSTDIQVFTGNGTWTKPGGAQTVRIIAIGGGGAGGSGGVSNAAGGGGGSGGGLSDVVLNATDVTATVAVTIGTGGTPVSNTSGGNGVDTTFGSYVKAGKGTGGTGGGNAASAVAGGTGTSTGGAGGASSNTTAGSAGSPGSGLAPAGGAGGGAGGSGNPSQSGGVGGSNIVYTTAAGGTAGSGAGGVGGAGTAGIANEGIGGGGGGGGAGAANNSTGAGGTGGAGALYGGGGGGGGGFGVAGPSLGGVGAAGVCIVITSK